MEREGGDGVFGGAKCTGRICFWHGEPNGWAHEHARVVKVVGVIWFKQEVVGSSSQAAVPGRCGALMDSGGLAWNERCGKNDADVGAA